MAHKGYYGPVHFRRDLSQNIGIYRLRAYGLRYRLSLTSGRDDPWTPGFPTPYWSAVGTDDISPMLTFTWPVISFLGHTWQLIVRAEKPATPAVSIYQTVRWLIDGVESYRAQFGGLFFNTFALIPSWSPATPHIGSLPGGLETQFGQSVQSALWWKDY